jgi:hypothetical protein
MLRVDACDELKSQQLRLEISRTRLELLKETSPCCCIVEPCLEAELELVLHLCRKAPERHRAWAVIHLTASVGRNSKDRPCLSEVVGTAEAAPQDRSTERTELTIGVPPAGQIHLSDPRDY